MSEHPKPGKAQALLALLSMAMVTWYMMPPQERYWVRLAALQKMHRLSALLARSEGRQGMAAELKGFDPWPRYGVAYQFSRLRDHLARQLEDMRP